MFSSMFDFRGQESCHVNPDMTRSENRAQKDSSSKILRKKSNSSPVMCRRSLNSDLSVYYLLECRGQNVSTIVLLKERFGRPYLNHCQEQKTLTKRQTGVLEQCLKTTLYLLYSLQNSRFSCLSQHFLDHLQFFCTKQSQSELIHSCIVMKFQT